MMAAVTFGTSKICLHQLPVNRFYFPCQKIVGLPNPATTLLRIISIVGKSTVNITGAALDTLVDHVEGIFFQFLQRIFAECIRVFRLSIHLALHDNFHITGWTEPTGHGNIRHIAAPRTSGHFGHNQTPFITGTTLADHGKRVPFTTAAATGGINMEHPAAAADPIVI